jgi:hypothetical protein
MEHRTESSNNGVTERVQHIYTTTVESHEDNERSNRMVDGQPQTAPRSVRNPSTWRTRLIASSKTSKATRGIVIRITCRGRRCFRRQTAGSRRGERRGAHPSTRCPPRYPGSSARTLHRGTRILVAGSVEEHTHRPDVRLATQVVPPGHCTGEHTYRQQAVFQIRDILARIRILGSLHLTLDLRIRALLVSDFQKTTKN